MRKNECAKNECAKRMRKNECAKMSVCCARIDATRLATKLLDVMTECAKMNAQKRMRQNECVLGENRGHQAGNEAFRCYD